MSLTKNSNQLFLPGGATNSQNSPYISVWPLLLGEILPKTPKFRHGSNLPVQLQNIAKVLKICLSLATASKNDLTSFII